MAIRFDASTDRLLRSNPDIDGADLYSVCMWIKRVGTLDPPGGIVYSLNTNDTAGNTNIDAILVSGNQKLQSYVGDSVDSGFSAEGTTLTANQWYFVCGVRSSLGVNGYSLYLNGVLDTQNAYDCTGRTASFTREEIALLYSINQYLFNGSVFNFMFYRWVLTPEQIMAQMRQFEPILPQPYLRLHTAMRDRGFRARHYDRVQGAYWTIGGTLTDEPNPPKAGSQFRKYFFVPLAVAGGSSTDLIVQDATHIHAADAIALTVSAYLAITDATHDHAADAIALIAQSSLSMQNATHEHAADGITLTLSVSLAVQDATHEHAVDSIELTVNAALAVDDVTHTHTTDAIGLTVNSHLAIQDATHEHVVDAIGLTVNAYLALQDAMHEHVVDSITLTVEGQTSLTVQDATHVHAADGILLSAVSYLAVTDAMHEHVVDAIALTTNAYLAVTEATHSHAADSIVLTVNPTLTIDKATHNHAADAISLTTQSYLSVQDATHVHIVDGITLTIEGQVLLTVQKAFHLHSADVVNVNTRYIFHLRYNEPYPFYPNE